MERPSVEEVSSVNLYSAMWREALISHMIPAIPSGDKCRWNLTSTVMIENRQTTTNY